MYAYKPMYIIARSHYSKQAHWGDVFPSQLEKCFRLQKQSIPKG